MIEVANLGKRYGDKLAVDGLDFTVQPGVVTGFLGPNGAGKPVTELRHSLVCPGAARMRADQARYPDRVPCTRVSERIGGL